MKRTRQLSGQSLAVMMAATTACLWLLLFVKLPTGSLTWSSLQNTGHYFLFTVLSIVYLSQFEHILGSTILRNVVTTVVFLGLMGLLTEGIQILLPGRSASSSDLLRNFAGISTGVISYASYHFRQRLNSYALTLIVFLVASIAFCFSRATIDLIGYSILKTPLPVVLALDDPFVLSKISTTGGAETTIGTAKLPGDDARSISLRMDFSEQQYSGVVFHEPGDRWPVSSSLTLNIYNNEQQSRQLHIRIHDAVHNNQYDDRFNAKFNVIPGKNEVTIPVASIREFGGTGNSSKRVMDTRNISELQLFSSDDESFTLHLQNIVLVQH